MTPGMRAIVRPQKDADLAAFFLSGQVVLLVDKSGSDRWSVRVLDDERDADTYILRECDLKRGEL